MAGFPGVKGIAALVRRTGLEAFLPRLTSYIERLELVPNLAGPKHLFGVLSKAWMLRRPPALPQARRAGAEENHKSRPSSHPSFWYLGLG